MASVIDESKAWKERRANVVRLLFECTPDRKNRPGRLEFLANCEVCFSLGQVAGEFFGRRLGMPAGELDVMRDALAAELRRGFVEGLNDGSP